jgi:hypothetical protein
MKKRILDTSILIAHWRKRRGSSLAGKKTSEAGAWAKELVDLYESNAIVTPVYLEMVAGVTGQQELKLTCAYLGQFECVDHGHMLPKDWENAIRLAQRVPKNKKPRNLGDCLIRAIADRLHYEIKTFDKGFPS